MKAFSFAIFIFLFSSNLSAQPQFIDKKISKKLTENITDFWKTETSDFQRKDVPDKWKNNSAVIIASQKILDFDKLSSSTLDIVEKTRMKIFLKDNNALKQFSELYFFVSEVYKEKSLGFKSTYLDNGFAARVIKPDGKVIEVALEKAVYANKIMSEIPERFRPYIGLMRTVAGKKETYIDIYKLAIPELQVGDILEYASIIQQISDVKENPYYEFDPIYYLCNRELPVVKQSIEIKTDSKSYVNTKSLNQAPEFKEIAGDKVNIYRWEDADRDKVNDQRWLNSFMVLPLIKFQIIFSKDGYGNKLFIGDKGELKRSFSQDELAIKARKIVDDMDGNGDKYHLWYKGENILGGLFIQSPMTLLKKIKNKLSELDAKAMPDDDYVNKLYYAFRNIAIEEKRFTTSHIFSFIFIKLLKERNIPCELLLTSRNDLTLPKDILFKEEVILLVKVNDKYIFNFSPFSNVYESDADFLGNEAYKIDLEKKSPTIKVTLPETKWNENKSDFLIESKLDNSLENLEVSRRSSFSGLSKTPNNAIALVHTEVFENDFKTFGAPNPLDGLKKKEKEGAEKAIYARQEENKKKKPEIMKSQLQEDFANIVSYNAFDLLSDGRSTENVDLSYREKFVLSDFVKKAGKNLLISVPSLMGGQIQLQPEEKIRQHDIDLRYPRHLHWNISFHIPDGYLVEGLEDLNMNIDNEAGSFITIASFDGNKVMLDIKKIYKEREVKKESLNKMTEFLDAAYIFSQKKIVLRKK